ncbi:voltage-gated potassium channel [Natronincola peptidivorans]|uniref:Voltage-gated potassium channel n=1 Tax=Natronincola peptidivorans TaxID=426128 RepID=A0A1H9ZUU8_9FIRM|nr:potassium channel protein [Natronincola peptidivorans]SES85142.1 voltage-gated potassium channel [Natronincola peptidivorans]
MDIKDKSKIIMILSAFISIIIIGTVGYMLLLQVSFIDALYMTVITISTVGYGEVGEMTASAMLFSIVIIFFGLGTAGYAFTSVVSLFLEGTFKEAWRRKRMEDKIGQLKDHYILCGAGETGQSIIEQFEKSKVPFVVIDKNEKQVAELMAEGVLIVQGDATHEDVLIKCRIHEAKGLITSLPDDAANVFVVLTARELNKNLYIVSRAIERNSRGKLKKAGANNTISPNEIGGRRMAALILRPSVISFLDIITHAGDVVLDLEDVVICEHGEIVGKTLKEAKIPERTGLVVLAIKKHGKKNLMLNPSFDETLNVGDVMIVLGQEKQVHQLREIACDCGERDPLDVL